MFDLEEFIEQKWRWSKQNFGLGLRTLGITNHIRKELTEVEADPKDIEEWIDVILLAIDGASRAGHSGHDIVCALIAKQLKNNLRTWPEPKGQDHPIEHDREALVNCKDCYGTGTLRRFVEIHGMEDSTACPTCRGSGTV